MRHLTIIFLILLPSMLFGQEPNWRLNKVNKTNELKYEYWLHTTATIDLSGLELTTDKDSTKVITQTPVVYEIHSKNELTEEDKEAILTCILEHQTDFNSKCSVRKKYQIYGQI